MAHALDAVESGVGNACELAVERIGGSEHMQVELAFDISDTVDGIAELYGVEGAALKKEAMLMLRDGLQRRLRPLFEVRYVKPFVRDGLTVGMSVRVCKRDFRVNALKEAR